MSTRKTRVFKILISVFLLYHLSAVIILPNGSSIIGRKLSWLFTPYANPLLFNRTWQFFSPGPLKAFYLEYDVIKEGELEEDASYQSESEAEASAPFVYPPVRSYLKIDDYFLRTLAGMQFIAVQPHPFEQYFVPFLCRKHPGAVSLDIRSVLEEIPEIETVRDDKTFSEMSKAVKLPRRVYECVPPSEGPVEASELESDV